MTLTQLDAARPPGPVRPRPTRTAPSTGGGCAARSPRWALLASAIAAVGISLGSLVAGRLAEDATRRWSGCCRSASSAAAVLDTAGRTLWAGVVDRAEGRLRADLLDAAMHQPLPR